MAINPTLLIAAPILQDYLVDKDTGMPLAGGVVTLYHDNARSFFKNWYYQTGAPGAYTFIPLDNPLTLSSVGTIQDPNGNDVIPFFYPYDENNESTPDPYYITVYSSPFLQPASVLQFTRENFPYNPNQVTPGEQNPTWRNYILNNVYWRNVGPQNLTNVTSMVIVPSQHEGYTNGDIQFVKNTTGGADSLAFSPMTTTLINDITPELFLSLQCSNSQVGETQKAIRYPISLHVKTLNSVPGTIKIHAQNVAGSPNNTLSLYFYQFLGTGAATQPAPILIQTIVLNSVFQEYLVPFITPSSVGLSLGPGGDDALFLLVQYPLGVPFNINHAKPQIYFSADVPTNDFDTYDQIETIINSPRTGDYRTSLNSFQPFGWVAANDGTIGTPASNATTRANIDTWPLYNLIWNSVLNNWAPVTGGRGASAIADFSANKQLQLTRTLGRVIAGQSPTFASEVFTTNYASDHFTLTVSSTAGILNGSPIQFKNTGGALPSALNINTGYYAIVINLTSLQVATTIENATAVSPVPLDIGSDSTGISTVLNALGLTGGESQHTLTVPEMPSHTHHTYSLGGGVANENRGGSSSTTPNDQGTSSATGGSLPHNNIQPLVFANVYFKL